MPAGQIIGRVAVKVLPDTDDFRREAEKQLSRIEKTLDFKVTIEIDTTKLDESLRKVKDQLNDWRDREDPLKIGVQVDMLAGQTALVSARLAVLTRPRTVPIIPVMSDSALGSVIAALAALSGGRVLGDLLTRLKDVGLEFDRWAPKIGAAASAIGTLGAVALASISNVFALSVSIASIGAAALALPGIFGGFAIGVGALVSAFIKFKDVLPGVVKGFLEANDAMRNNFWDAAAKPIREMAEVLLPLWADGFAKVGTALGAFIGALSTGFGDTLAPLMDAMFANLNDAIAKLTAAAPAISNTFSILASAGAATLPQLATAFAGILENFNAFISAAASDGRLQQWINDGFQAISDLGSSIASIAGIIKAIGDAAAAAGGSSLGMLADTLNSIQKVAESPAFQEGLTTAFEAAHQALSLIAGISGPAVQQLFTVLADSFAAISPSLGLGIGTAIEAIATALSSPAFQGALVTLFEGLANAIVALAPAMLPLANAMASLVPVVVALLEVIAPLVTAALVPLSALMERLAPAIIPVIGLLGDGLLQIISILAPLMLQLADAMVPFVAALVEGLAPIMPLIIQSFLGLAQAILPLLPVIMQLLMDVIIPLLPAITELVGILPLMMQGFAQIVIAALPLIKLLTGFIALIIGFVAPAITFLAKVLSTVLKFAIDGAVSAVGWLSDQITSIVGNIKDTWNKYWKVVTDAFSNAWDSIRETGGALFTWFRELPDKIKGFFSGAGDWLKDIGGKIIGGLIDGIKNAFGGVRDVLGDLTSKLTDWKGPPEKDAVLLKGAGQLIIDGFIDGLESRYDAVKDSLKGLSSDIAATDLTSSIEAGLNQDGAGSAVIKQINYYAAPGSSLGSEEDLFSALDRGRAGW